MNCEEYAKKYAGKNVRVVAGAYTGSIGIVSGWLRDLWILLEIKYYVIYRFPFKPMFSYDTTHTFVGWGLTRILPKYMKWDAIPLTELELMEPLIQSNTPDNCDDCGAIGEAPCKEGCPNKHT